MKQPNKVAGIFLKAIHPFPSKGPPPIWSPSFNVEPPQVHGEPLKPYFFVTFKAIDTSNQANFSRKLQFSFAYPAISVTFASKFAIFTPLHP